MNKIDGLVKKGAPECGLYIRLSQKHVFDPQIIKLLREMFFVINSSKYEKNMHAIEVEFDKTNEDKIHEIIGVAQANGIVCVLTDILDKDEGAKPDGLIVKKVENILRGKEVFNEEGIVGLECGADKNLAQQAIENEVDYVTFSGKNESLPNPDLIKWWSTKSDKPAVALGSLTNDCAAYYIEAGATFLEATDYIFNHKEGVMKGTVNMLYAIDIATDKKSSN